MGVDALVRGTDDGGSPSLVHGRRGYLATVRALLVLFQVMSETRDDTHISQLAVTAVPTVVPEASADVRLNEQGWLGTLDDRSDVRAAVEGLEERDTEIDLDEGWAWAHALRSSRGFLGHLVVVAPTRPREEEQFLLRLLAQHASAAIGNAQLHADERIAVAGLGKVNEQLRETVAALQRSMDIHRRLSDVAMTGGGQQGLAEALHDVTGHAIAIEDEYGNLRAWAGSNRPDPYPKRDRDHQTRLLQRALHEGRPVRDGDTVIAVARPRADLLGAIVLHDAEGVAGEQEQMALGHGTTVLSMELARLRSVADSELRVRRDLVEELLAGTDEESAVRRARALRYDIERPHRVVIAEQRGYAHDVETFLHAVRRAARDEGVGTLLTSRGERIVVLAESDVDWEQFRRSVLRELGSGRCTVGVGRRCEQIRELPRSHRQAQLALDLHRAGGWDDRVAAFEELGVYRLFAELRDHTELEQFARQQLAPLLAYDEETDSELVRTLGQYLEFGGSYEPTAEALFIHRSTLKYRLKRIREIAGLDLSDPDTCFNLQLATRALTTLAILRDEPGP